MIISDNPRRKVFCMGLLFSDETFAAAGLNYNTAIYGFVYILLSVLLIMLVIIIRNYSKRISMYENMSAEEGKKEIVHENSDEYEKLLQENQSLNEKIEELKKNRDRLYTMAYNDKLTNLPNRHALCELIDSTITTLRKDEQFVLVHIDLDNFKSVNDKLGHSYGDELILDASHRLMEALDENDYLSRIGSDEFIILSQNIEDIADYEEKIRKFQKVFAYPFIISGREIFITISMGIVVAPKDGKNTGLLLRNADLAMLEAKNNGRNTCCYYGEQIGEKYAQKLEMQSEITKAIENGEFQVYYQPVIDFSPDRNKQEAEYEALLRWNHPEKGLLLPEQFLPVAIKTGQIVLICEIVLDNVFERLAREADTKISVNLSNREFFSGNLIDMIKIRVEKYNIDASRLELELKEDIFADESLNTMPLIEKLRSMGIEIIVDNFGVRLASMTALGISDISKIKIDKSFVDAAMFEETYKLMIEAIIKVSDSLGIKTIAEGVESVEQEKMLKSVKCKCFQGFYYGAPKKYKKKEY